MQSLAVRSGPASAPRTVVEAQRPKKARPPANAASTLDAPALETLRTLLFYIVLAATLAFFWGVRQERWIDPEVGIGYALGIVGGSMMLLLGLYPLRKNLKCMRGWGPVRYWFRVHMVFGVLGPVLVLLHSAFQLGSLNSTVALFSMLVVAASGFIGRYLYTKIHYGLYGSRASLRSLQLDAEVNNERLGVVFAYAPALQGRLKRFEEALLNTQQGQLSAALRLFTISVRMRLIKWVLMAQLNKALRKESARSGWSRKETRRRRAVAQRFITEYVATACRVATFSAFERLFGLWHLLHLPLLFLLLLAGVIHVLAVHMY